MGNLLESLLPKRKHWIPMPPGVAASLERSKAPAKSLDDSVASEQNRLEKLGVGEKIRKFLSIKWNPILLPKHTVLASKEPIVITETDEKLVEDWWHYTQSTVNQILQSSDKNLGWLIAQVKAKFFEKPIPKELSDAITQRTNRRPLIVGKPQPSHATDERSWKEWTEYLNKNRPTEGQSIARAIAKQETPTIDPIELELDRIFGLTEDQFRAEFPNANFQRDKKIPAKVKEAIMERYREYLWN